MSYEESVDHFLSNFCTCEEQLTRSKTIEGGVCEVCKKDQVVNKSVLERVLSEKRKRKEIAENPIYQSIPNVVREIRNQTERLRSESDIFQEGDSQVYDNVDELHLGGTQGDQLYSDPDRNIILTLTPPRRRRENLAQVNRGEYPELNQPEEGLEQNQGQPLLDQEDLGLEDLEMENAARGLRDSIMGLNQERFSGLKDEDPDTFFVRIERHANFSGWDEDRKLHAVFLALRGTASDFAETLPVATKANYDLLKTALTNHFKVNKSKVLQWQEIQDFSLRSGQSVTNYYDELRKLATRLGGISDEQLLVMFIKGLPRDLKIQVMAKEPRTLADGLDAARLFEGMLDVQKDNSTSATNPFASSETWNSRPDHDLRERVSNLTKFSEKVSSSLETLSKRMDEIALVVKRGEPSLHEKPYTGDPWETGSENKQICFRDNPSNNFPNTPPDGRRGTTDRPFKDDVKCYFCGNRGHRQADCWSYQHQQQMSGETRRSRPNSTGSTNVAHIDVSVNQDMTFPGEVLNNKIWVLADSGSRMTMMSADCYNRLNPRPKLERPEYAEVAGVSGVATPVAGLTKI